MTKQQLTKRQLIKEHNALQEAGAVISSKLDLQEILTRLAELVCQVVGGTSSYILSYNPKPKKSTVLAEFYGPQANPKERVSDLGKSYAIDEEDYEYIETGTPEQYYVDDEEITEAERAHIQQYGGQTVLNIPLRIRGRTAAYVELWDSREKRAFTPEEVALCQSVAQQAAIAIENTRLYEEAQREISKRKHIEKALRRVQEELELRVQERITDLAQVVKSLEEEIAERKRAEKELGAIIKLSSALRDAKTQADVMPILVEHALETFRADVCTLALWEDGELVVAAAHGVNLVIIGQRIPQDCETFWQVVQTRKPIFFAISGDEIKNALVEMERDLFQDAVSLAIVPLETSDIVVGVLHLTWHKRGDFSSVDHRVLAAFADVAGIALFRSHIMETLDQRVAERTRDLAILYKVTSTTTGALGLLGRLNKFLTAILETTPFDAGTIHLLNDTNTELVMQAQQGFSSMKSTMERMGIEEDLWDRFVKGSRILALGELKNEPQTHSILMGSELTSYTRIPIYSKNLTIGALSIFIQNQHVFSDDELGLLIAIADHIGIAVERDTLRHQAEESIIISERHRLARELHDSVTQSLYSIRLYVNGGAQYAKDGNLDEAKNYFQELEKLSQQVIEEMRLLLYELKPLELEQVGLEETLRQRLDSIEQRANVKTQLTVDQSAEISLTLQNGLYHIALEALNNAIRHAKASSVTIHLYLGSDKVVMDIVDNGIGFDVHTSHRGMGLTNMRERAEELGGTFNIISSPGQGTIIVTVFKEGIL